MFLNATEKVVIQTGFNSVLKSLIRTDKWSYSDLYGFNSVLNGVLFRPILDVIRLGPN